MLLNVSDIYNQEGTLSERVLFAFVMSWVDYDCSVDLKGRVYMNNHSLFTYSYLDSVTF
jgi:hypothetical protein